MDTDAHKSYSGVLLNYSYNIDNDGTTNNDCDSDEPSTSIYSFVSLISRNDEHILLAQNGYKKINKICDTLQGELFKAEITKLNTSNDIKKYVTIKKIDKQLNKQNIAIQDDIHFCVEENIIKEAMILKHLTVDNTPIGQYINHFIDYFQSETHFYLVTQYIHGMDLKQFINKAQQYIADGKLKLNDYRRSAKFIIWQLLVTLHELHNVFHCCHLDICLENILLENADFIQCDDGLVSINNDLSVQLVDFGVSEIFSSDNMLFQCNKQRLTLDNGAYVAPQIYNEEIYDARAADMWSLGMIFYQCMTGKPLYEPQDIMKQYPFNMEKTKLKQYWSTHDATKYFKKRSFSFLKNLLKVDEHKRLNASQAIQHEYFKAYYQRYNKRLSQSYINNQNVLQNQSEKMSQFPFYELR